MRILIVEDERPARELLAAAIREAAADAEIVAELTGVAETTAWLEQHPTLAPFAPAVFGIVVAPCFFVPGLKYYRQQTRVRRQQDRDSTSS